MGGGGRWAAGWLGVLVVGAALLRALPFLGSGALDYPVDYDEGVYFTASALLAHGAWPYRDFFFVHPPGALLLWGPAAWWTVTWDAATCFALARGLAVGAGAVSTALVGRLAGRTWGPGAGLLAALVYATYPEAVAVERGPFLEPWLNLACLGLANLWLEPPGGTLERRRWLVGAGVLAGLAVSVKALGGIWLVAALLAHPWREGWRARLGLGLVAAGTVALVVGPFFLASPTGFLEQVLHFQAARPGDGALSRLERLHELFHPRRLAGVGLALGGLGLALSRAFRAPTASRPAERLVAFAYVVTGAAFLSSPSYWNQYNAYLAASESLLAGLGAGALLGRVRAWRPPVAWGLGAALACAVVLSTRPTLRDESRRRSPDQPALGQALRALLRPEDALCAFEPAWGVFGGRLPARPPGASLVVDSYAVMLHDAMTSGERFTDTNTAFDAPASQRHIRALLEHCDAVVLGWRGEWQLSEDSLRWFRARFARRFPPEGQPGPDVWTRTGP